MLPPFPDHPVVRLLLQRDHARMGEGYGVLANVFGECMCVREGQSLLQHEDVRSHALVNVAERLEGASSLTDAAHRLRALAISFDTAAAEGWVITHDVVDGLVAAQLTHP